MRFRDFRLTVGALILSLPALLQAQTWSGLGGNANVSNAGNWNSAPLNNGSASLVFPTASPSAVNFDSPYSVNSMTFSGSSSYSISGSTLTIGTGGIASTASLGVNFNNPLTFAGAATISTTSANIFLGAINNGGFNLTMSSASGTQSVLVTGNITGAGGLTATGTGVTFLTGTGNTYAGGTTINSGATLQIGDPGGSSAGSLPGNVTNNGMINFKPVNSSLTYGGVISGSGSLNMLGSNKLTLTGANTYSSGSTINGGQVIVKNSTGSGLGSGAVTVNNGARLEGSGSFTGPLTLNSGAAIAPDVTLTVGATTINGGAGFLWQVADVTGVAGTNWGLLNLNANTLTLNANSGNQITVKAVTFQSIGGSMGSALHFDTTANYSWNLTTGVSSLIGFTGSNQFLVDTSAFANPFTGTFSVGTSGSNLVLNYTGGSPIPEPAVAGLLAGLLTLAGVVLRRRRAGRT